MGQHEFVKRYGDALIESVENDGPTLEVMLAEDGYRCPELVP